MLDHVAQIDGGLAAVGDHDRGVFGGVPGRLDHGDIGGDLGLAVDELDLARRLDRQQVLRQVGGACALVGVDRLFPLAALDVVARVGEGDGQVVAVSASLDGVPAGVVVVQVCVDHDVDIGGLDAVAGEIVEQLAVIGFPTSTPSLLEVLVALASLDQHGLAVRLQ